MHEKYISILATILLIAAAGALFMLNHGLLGNGPVSVTVQMCGILLVLWARLTFGWRSYHAAANPTRGPLITSGPYHYIRNPIYAAVLLVCWGGIAAHWSVLNALLGFLIAATLAVKIWCEETLLRAAYPEYRAYEQSTARIIPYIL
ncbi:MAG TPA: methyltransferase [Candidatus Limnocylindrales bacterium]|nr:methyltransferase [Candidatus Limnocylindrales bacterium]